MSNPEVTVKTEHFDPQKHGERGLLMYQDKSEVYSNGSETIYEVNEWYRKEEGWVESDEPYKNDTSSDVELEITSRRWVLIDSSERRAYDLGFKGNFLEPKTTKVTVKPGETLYRYTGQEAGIFRKWWILKLDGKEQIISHSDTETLDVSITYSVNDRVLTRNTELTGEKYFDYELVENRLSDVPGNTTLSRVMVVDLPNDLMRHVFAIHQRAYDGKGWQAFVAVDENHPGYSKALEEEWLKKRDEEDKQMQKAKEEYQERERRRLEFKDFLASAARHTRMQGLPGL